MKNHFYYLCLLLGLVFGVMMFTACGDDDEDPNVPGGQVSGIRIKDSKIRGRFFDLEEERRLKSDV